MVRKRDEQQLVAEVEAFLVGHVGEVVLGKAVYGEPWVRVNWIAHAEPGELVAAAGRVRHREPDWGSWPWAVDTVLRELVAAAGPSPGRMEELQRACLIPYELMLMGRPTSFTTPFEMVAEAVSSIRSFPADSDW